MLINVCWIFSGREYILKRYFFNSINNSKNMFCVLILYFSYIFGVEDVLGDLGG